MQDRAEAIVLSMAVPADKERGDVGREREGGLKQEKSRGHGPGNNLACLW